MNPQWNTPPDGDFARYVERLAAQATQPHRPPQEGEHGLDVGMTPSSPPHGAAGDAASATRRRMLSNGEASPARDGGAAAHAMAKVLAIAWMAVLLVLLILKVPFGIVAAVFAFGLWLAHRLRRWALPPGVANWREWLEEEARKQKQRQQQGRNK
ncbi:hypothetical protein H6CHR_02522 [Variovorax sp. PBL-H6]|nr:hypothetical protein H6CHR_02522 [Variovorax sp. PBL-H6]